MPNRQVLTQNKSDSSVSPVISVAARSEKPLKPVVKPAINPDVVVPVKPVQVKQTRLKQVLVKPASDPLNWSELAPELELGGLARQIVMNCIVNLYEGDQLQLAFLPELEVMLKPDIESQIKQAIKTKLGVSLNIIFSCQSSLKCETPHQADVRKQEQERQQVIQSIRQDPVVIKLKSVFGAELIEDSVKKTILK